MAGPGPFSTYVDEKILSRPHRGVERPLLGLFLILLLVSVPLARSAEITEPDPLPQLSFGPDEPLDEAAEAQRLLHEKKWAEAVVLLRSVLKESPDDSSIQLDLVRALVYSGRREEALTVLGQMISRRKGEARRELIQKSRVISRVFLKNKTFQVYQDGLNLLLAGKYRSAKEKFEKALEEDSSNVESLTRLSQCLILEGDVDSAAERLRVARRLDPYEPQISLWLGRALHQRGEVRDALTELKSAYQKLPSSETAAVWYAEALFGFGQRDPAIEVLQDDVQRYPNHIRALIALSRYRLMNGSLHDTQVAWTARKDMQLALSRLPLYHPLGTEEGTNAKERGSVKVDPMGDLALPLKHSEADLKHEIQKLMEEADGRIDTAAGPVQK